MINDFNVLKSIIQSSAEGIIISDREGNIVLANPRAEQLFGYGDQELLNKKIEVLLPKPLQSKHKHYRKSFNENPRPRSMGQGLDLFGMKKDGSQFPLEVSLSYSKFEETLYIIAFVIDITERKLSERKVLESEERLRYFVKHAPVAIAMTDVDLRYLLLSAKWLKEQHKTLEELQGLRHPDVFPNHQEHWNDSYMKGLSGEIVRKEEEMVQHKDGSQDWIRWEVHPWRDSQNRIGGLIIFIEDITKRKIAELALKESRSKLKRFNINLQRSNRELEEFAHIASHDLQEPLRKIQTFASMLKTHESETLSDKGKDYLGRMINSSNRMKKLITDLLTFSRLSTKNQPFEKVQLSKIFEEVLSDTEVSISKSGAQIAITTTLPAIRGDATQLRQLFQNLISNAIKFRKADVPLIVNIAVKAHEESKKSKMCIIEITDNGIGFDQKFSDKIFNIFHRLEGKKYEGSGIGLSICKKIVNRHGGDIEVRSQMGKGTTFSVKLPFSPVNHED